MSRSVEAIIEPSLLVWARRSIGLDVAVAAKKIGVSTQRLAAWEAGEERPSVAQLRSAAVAYKRPLAIFYLPEPPVDYQPLRDYRRLPDTAVGRLSPKLHAVIRRAHAVRETALELRELADEAVAPPPQLEVVRGSDPEEVATAARALLSVPLERQFSWEEPSHALAGWIRAIERLDVLVLQVQAVPIDEMRGFSISADRLPVIALNGGDYPRGRIFTLFHEFAHILLNAEGVCDLLPRRRVRRPTDEIEIFCNQVAAAALMPADAFEREPAVRSGAVGGRWSDDVLEGLAARYSVSQEAVVRRLFTLGLTHWDFVQQKQEQYRAAYKAHREEQRQRRREQADPGGPSYYRMKVRDLGRGFIESALDAYYRRAITGSDLSEYLEIKLNHIPGLERELALTAGSSE